MLEKPGGFAFSSHPKLNLLPLAAKLVSAAILSWSWQWGLGIAPGKVIKASFCSYLNLKKFFKNNQFPNCCVALTGFQCDGIVIFVNVFQLYTCFLWRGNIWPLFITLTGSPLSPH